MPLSLNYDSLRQEISRHAGYTGTLATMASITGASADVESALVRGQRKFYFQAGHVWSFLQKSLTVSLAAGAETTDLPEDLWQIIGSLSFAADSKLQPISIVSEEQIRALRAQSDTTGVPIYAAIRARAVIDGRRYELLTYPRPDVAYELTGRYAYEPPMLDDRTPNPAGGALHSETLLAACLCAVDERLGPEDGQSVHCARYAEALAASIKIDQELSSREDSAAWPLDSDNSPSDLGANREYIDRQIGLILKFGPNPAAWTHGQRAEIARVRERGLRRFYTPDVLPGEKRAHRWNFLRPVLQIDLQADESEYDLPANLSMIQGPLTYAPDSSIRRPTIPIVSEPQVRHALTGSTATGEPRQAAVRFKQPQGDQPQRQQLLVYPRPDAAYTLHYRAVLNPYSLPNPTSTPLGSPEHAETILVACLATAEEIVGDSKTMPYSKRYPELLRSSVFRDREEGSSDTMGTHTTWMGANGEEGLDDGFYDRSAQYVTYNGSVP